MILSPLFILAAICVSGVSAGTMRGPATSTLNTLVAGETPTVFSIALTPATTVPNFGTITCTYDQDVFAVQRTPFAVQATPASPGLTATTSARVITMTVAAATVPVGPTSFAISANLAANPAPGAVYVSCVSTTDPTALVVASYTTTAPPTHPPTAATSAPTAASSAPTAASSAPTAASSAPTTTEFTNAVHMSLDGGVTWSFVAAAGAQVWSERSNFALVADTLNARLVLWSGNGAGGDLADVWTTPINGLGFETCERCVFEMRRRLGPSRRRLRGNIYTR